MVANELTQFCEGRHPMFPGVVMDGSDGDTDYRLNLSDPEQCGTFYRDEAGQLSLLMGTVEQPGEGAYKDVKEKNLDFFKRFPDVKAFVGVEDVCDYMSRKCSCPGSLALRDHYAYWKASGMVSEAGKAFFFDLRRCSAQHAVFFDDNLDYDNLKIICPIDLQQRIERSSALALLRSHVCKTEPLMAIKDRRYFVTELERLEVGYERRLRARERLLKVMHGVRASLRWRALCSRRAQSKGEA
mmetsp:Transcript_25275/g.50647  ORF Transcript_25275/g.50647 Transcript_25275/m.50647 type:complete len:242 (-) Transcript_25275:46-771(-)